MKCVRVNAIVKHISQIVEKNIDLRYCSLGLKVKRLNSLLFVFLISREGIDIGYSKT